MSALRARTARGRRKSHSAWRRVRSKGPRDTLQLCLTMHRRGQHPSQAVRYRRGRRGLAPLRVLQHAAAAVAPLDGDGLGMPQRRVLPPTRASTHPHDEAQWLGSRQICATVHAPWFTLRCRIPRGGHTGHGHQLTTPGTRDAASRAPTSRAALHLHSVPFRGGPAALTWHRPFGGIAWVSHAAPRFAAQLLEARRGFGSVLRY